MDLALPPTSPASRSPLQAAIGVAAALAVAVFFHLDLLHGGALAGFDWAIHYHYYDWIRTGFTQYAAFPLFMPDAWHSTNLVANAQVPLFGPLVGLLAWLDTASYIRLLIVLYTAAGLLGTALLAMDLGARRSIAVLAALLYACGGFFAAHVSVGHHWALGAYLLPWLLLLSRRAARGSRAALVAAACVDALALLEGQHHPFLWQNGFLLGVAGLSALRERDTRWLRVSLGIVVLAALLACVRLLPLIDEFGDYAPTDRIAGLAPSAVAASLLVGSRGPGDTGLGGSTEFGAGIWEYHFYLGAVGVLLLALGVAASARRSWPWWTLGLACGWLALDTRSLGFDAWDWLQHVPGLSTQRSPSRLLLLLLFALSLCAASGLERIARAVEGRSAGLRRAVPIVLACLALLLTADLVRAARPWQDAALGDPLPRRSHRLKLPLLVGGPGAVELADFAPNRIELLLRASQPGRLVFPLLYETQVGRWDTGPYSAFRAPGGGYALRVPAGEQRVVLRYAPPWLWRGATLSLLTLLGAWAWVLLRRWRPRSAGPAALALLAAVLPLVGCRAQPQVERVVLVSIDTLRADRLGCYGDASAHTPHIDALARAGARFTSAIAPTPITLPSHTTLFTGLDPPRHGVRDNGLFALAPEIPTLAEGMQGAGFATAGFVSAFVLDARFGLARGFDVYDDSVGGVASKDPFSFPERPGSETVDAAIAWLERAPPRFFLFVHLYDPHADYRPPPRYRKLAGGDAYAGEIAFADAQVGRLLDAVNERFGGSHLVVAVTSDHGESLGEHGERSHALSVYDATQRIPLVLAGAGVPTGAVVESAVRLADLAPTLLGLAGAALPPVRDGQDLLPLVEGRSSQPRVAWVETLATQIQMGWSPLLGVRTDGHKYIRAPRPELYDLGADPDELHNLVEAEPERAAALDALVAARLAAARPVEPSTTLTPEDRARLEQLGYLVPAALPLGERPDLGVVGGRDPKDHMEDLERLHRASALLADGEPDRAIEVLGSLSAPTPRKLWLLAAAGVAAERPAVAVEAARLVVAGEGPSPASLTLLGYALLAKQALSEAAERFEEARALGPDRPDPQLGLGLVAEARGDREAALAAFTEADRLTGGPGPARGHRAALLIASGAVSDADELLSGLPPRLARDPSLSMRVAAAELAAGLPGRAAKRLAAAARAHRRHQALHAAWAEAALAAGDADTALAAWERRLVLEPENPSARNDLAWGLAAAGRDLERALDLAQSARRELGDLPPVLDTLATVHLVRGEEDRALDLAEQALATAPESLRPHLTYVRAAALAATGRRTAARDALASSDLGDLQAPWRERARDLAARLADSGD